MSIEEYKQAFLDLFKNMQDEFESNIKAINIWHNKSWTDSEREIHPEVYEVSIDFCDR